MRRTLSFSGSAAINWDAFRGCPSTLARRCGAADEWLIGVGELDSSEVSDPGHGFTRLKAFLNGHGDWVFGHLAYGMGAEAEPGLATGKDPMGWPALRFFVPRFVVHWKPTGTLVHCTAGDEREAERLMADITAPAVHAPFPRFGDFTHVSRERYLQRAGQFMSHIQRGDIYEVNYCIPRTGHAPGLDPFAAFGLMDAHLRAPHAAFYRTDGRYALCESPERFVCVQDRTITGEPMKGTRPRHHDMDRDRALAFELANDAKERSENIMTVDVMRNDLSRVAAPRSVRVDDLCQVRSLPALHQMTSTVRAGLREGLHAVDAIRSCFPMASMTGAPKKRAMELIDALEDAPRGLYSGALGFFTPEGDADFNVVIRTLLFDERTSAISLTTGSALTAACDPEKEWEECELKARSVLDALGHAG
ncbi:MAG: anthranilate synthase component I family protein [Flavobacteriales bacterium]